MVEEYSYGYDDDNIIRFNNAAGESIECAEVLTENTKYLVKISTKLEKTMANYDESDCEGFDDYDPNTVVNPFLELKNEEEE